MSPSFHISLQAITGKIGNDEKVIKLQIRLIPESMLGRFANLTHLMGPMLTC